MSNEKNLWLPNGVNIWSIVKVEKDYALKAIELGANKLISTDKE